MHVPPSRVELALRLYLDHFQRICILTDLIVPTVQLLSNPTTTNKTYVAIIATTLVFDHLRLLHEHPTPIFSNQA